jgi:L-alanine-DL-glutamate epimerase-like enolase superfamily enzyme
LIEDGEVVLGDEPGLGFNFDESVVDRYAINSWEEVS